MSWVLQTLRQVISVALVVVAAAAAWAVWVPASHGLLDRFGLLAPLESLGLPITREADSAEANSGRPGGFAGRGPVAVVTAEVSQGVLADQLSAIGTGEALRSVVLQPEASGRLAEILVASGDYVTAGAVLARLDSAAEQIARDRAELTLDEVRTTAARLQRLQATGTATEVQIREASLAVRQAELAVRQAELELARRVITAPFDGWVGIVEAAVGATVSQSSPVARLDDRSSIVVDFRVPERFVGRIRAGDPLSVAPLARSDEPREGHVLAVDSRVDQDSRSLRVQAALPNPGDDLRAGMAFNIQMNFTGRTHPAVPPLAIQWGNEGAFVWAVRDGRATQVPVRLLQRRDGQVLVQGEIATGETVVLEGVQSLREGTEVAPRAPQAGGDGAARLQPATDQSPT